MKQAEEAPEGQFILRLLLQIDALFHRSDTSTSPQDVETPAQCASLNVMLSVLNLDAEK